MESRRAVFWLNLAVKAALIGLLLLAVVRPARERRDAGGRAVVGVQPAR